MQDQNPQDLKKQSGKARQTIKDLQVQIDNYHCFIENSRDGVLVFNADGKLVFTNKRAIKLTGYDLAGLKEISLQDLLPGYKKTYTEPDAGQQEGSQCKHTSLWRKSGERLPVLATATPTTWDNSPAEMIILTDVSERVSRQKNEAVLAVIMEASKDFITVLDHERRMLFANTALRKFFFELYGLKIKPGKNFLSLLPFERGQFWNRTFEETFASGRRQFEQQYFIHDRRYDIEWHARRVLSVDGSTIGVAIVGRDITRQRRIEEAVREREAQLHQARKLEALGTLAGGVAHEFNNTLSIVLGNLEMAAMEIFDKHPIRSYLEDAKSGILGAKKVVHQLIEFNRKSDGLPQKVDLNATITSALNLLRASIPTHIEFHQLLSECPPIMADPSHMHQMVINLCTNSAEALDKDGGVLTVTLDHVHLKSDRMPLGVALATGNYAKLTVADNGPGMDEKVLKRIFKPSFSTEEPDSAGRSGLSAAHNIVKQHGGDIVASSAAGQGSKFEVYLPTMSRPEKQESPPDPSSLTGNERILLVDDEPKFVMMTQRQIESLGYRMEIFTSAIGALERFSAAPDDFDLVISDVAMPRMTGEKLINKIRLIRPDIPAIICTGYSDKVDRKTALRMGCQYVVKPVEMNRMAQVIRKALDTPFERPTNE